MERAENMARLLEVGYRISLMPGAVEGHRDEWRSTLQSAACDITYARSMHDDHQRQGRDPLPDLRRGQSLEHPRPPSSTARNNGRAVRTALTRDVWESINTTWNELAQVKPASITADRLPEFLDWIKQRVMSFRGALLGTMLRNDTYYFSQLGNFIERADNTARILDVKYFILLPKPTDVGSDLDMQQWATDPALGLGAPLLPLVLPRQQLPAMAGLRVPHPARGNAALAGVLLSMDQPGAGRPRQSLYRQAL